MTAKTVGVTVKLNRKKKNVYVTYEDVEKDRKRWAKASDFLPRPNDLVEMKTKESKILIGWWTGQGWDGLRITEDDIVIQWRKKKELI